MNRNDMTRCVNHGQSNFQQFPAQIADVLLMSSTQLATFIAPQNLHNIQVLLTMNLLAVSN